MATVLVVDDSAVDRRFVGELLDTRYDCSVQYAANGVEALARVKDVAPDVIITDLTMPVMDGLQLVTEARRHHPNIPIILMTAHGSETLAIEALERGAASYVPKVKLGERLLDTIEEVLTLSQADQSQAKLMACLKRTEFSFVLENEPALIDPLVNLVQQMVGGMGMVDFTGQLQIGVALKEALLNALFHGSLEISQEDMAALEDVIIQEDDLSLVEKRRLAEPYRDRKIHLSIDLNDEFARFVVRDEGPGFDTSQIPDLTEPGALEPDGRRGLSLMRTFMDEVTFNEAGNEVTLIKRADEAGSDA